MTFFLNFFFFPNSPSLQHVPGSMWRYYMTQITTVNKLQVCLSRGKDIEGNINLRQSPQKIVNIMKLSVLLRRQLKQAGCSYSISLLHMKRFAGDFTQWWKNMIFNLIKCLFLFLIKMALSSQVFKVFTNQNLRYQSTSHPILMCHQRKNTPWATQVPCGFLSVSCVLCSTWSVFKACPSSSRLKCFLHPRGTR